MPARHLVSTVLPAPLSPTKAVTWPAGMSRSTWYRAWTGPKCLSSSRTLRSGPSFAAGSATAAVMLLALSRRTKGDAAARCGGVIHVYEVGMLLAVQTAAPTCPHSADALTKLSLMTVAAMFDLSTQIGTRRDAGSSVPAWPDGGLVVPLTRAAGGFAPARRTVASATAAWASR